MLLRLGGVPLPTRSFEPWTADGHGEDLRERALTVLLAPELAHIVDLVAWPSAEGVHVADAQGHVVLGQGVVSGRDPVADQDPLSDASAPGTRRAR